MLIDWISTPVRYPNMGDRNSKGGSVMSLSVFVISLLVIAMITMMKLTYKDDIIDKLSSQSNVNITDVQFNRTVSDHFSPLFVDMEYRCRSRMNEYLEHSQSQKQNYRGNEFTHFAEQVIAGAGLTYLFVFVFFKFIEYNEYDELIINGLIKANKKYLPYISIRKPMIRVCFNFLLYAISAYGVLYDSNSESEVLFSSGLPQHWMKDVANHIKDNENVSKYLSSNLLVFKLFIAAWNRNHPTNAWFIRLTHALSYPSFLYAYLRPKTSQCVLLFFILSMTLNNLSEYSHAIHPDKQLTCFRDTFIQSITIHSIGSETFRIVTSHFVNVMCVAVDCSHLS
eukprot:349371_1